MSSRSIAIILGAVSMCCVLSVQVAGQNLLTNGGFETGDLPGWANWGAGAVDLFDGVFDNTWNNPAPECGGVATFGPHGGTYYLGRYKAAPQSCAGAIRGTLGAVFQTVSGLTPGTELYAQAFFASHHPHGGGADVRIGLDPDYVQPPPPDQGTPSPTTIWAPEPSPTGNPVFAYSESAYSKLETARAVVGPSGTMTIWVQYEMTENTVSEAQIVQVDDVRMATTHSMEIRNIDVLGISSTAVTISWETYDGASQLATNGQVDYGLTPSYELGTKIDSSNPRYNHSVNITGLTNGATYHFRLVNKLSGTPGYEDGVYTGTFLMVAGPKITNLTVTNITSSSAVVKWDTVDPSTNAPVDTDGRVDYGVTSNYGYSKVDPAPPTSHHEVTLTGLYPGQSYYYRVTSCGVGNPPAYGCKRATGASPFVTPPGPFWNGDFEIILKQPRLPDDPIPGWNKTGGVRWFNSGEWSIGAGHGSLYAGVVVNGGRGTGALYQLFETTPGETLSYSALVYSETTGSGNPCASYPHRFGEAFCRIGIDPTGGTNMYSGNVVWSSARETLDWRGHVAEGDCSIHPPQTGWQKISTMTKAQGTYATIFLDMFEYYGGGWNFMCFDDVKPEPVIDVSSVGEAKTLANDTPINLAGPSAAESPVVTYIVDPNLDPTENNGLPYFYVEDVNRTAGIKVTMATGSEWPTWLEVGKKVNIVGLLSWGVLQNRVLGLQNDQQLRLDKPCGERVIRAISVTDTGATGAVEPIGMGNKSIAGGSSSDSWFTNPGVPDGVGVNTVGLLVKTWGKIVAASDPGSLEHWIRIDDGSSVPAYSGSDGVGGLTGLYVPTGYMDYSADVGKYAIVTGISCVKNDYDWDDPTYVPGITMPEANVNVRYLKPLSYMEPDIVVLP